jgi:hypothetical protein
MKVMTTVGFPEDKLRLLAAAEIADALQPPVRAPGKGC